MSGSFSDNFADAPDLDLSAPATFTGGNVGATGEGANDPLVTDHDSHPATVWAKFTRDTTSEVTLRLHGTIDFDTLLGVYTGTFGALTEVAFNDDEIPGGTPGFGYPSAVTFTATAGVTYYIEIGSYPGSSNEGAITMAVSIDGEPPPPPPAEPVAPGTGWYMSLVMINPCDPTWVDTFERGSLGADWMPFAVPTDRGFIDPVITSGGFTHPTSGSGGQSDTELVASAIRTVESDCRAQSINANVHNTFQGQYEAGTAFRAHVDLILIADPDTGTHMRVRFQTDSTEFNRRFLVGVSFYTGPGGSDYEAGASYLSDIHPVADDVVYIINAVIWKATRRYMVTVDGVGLIDAIGPAVFPWGKHQGLAVRWSLGTAEDGTAGWVSPNIIEADGGGYKFAEP